MHSVADLRLIRDFPDDFYTRLIRQSCENQLPHQLRAVGYQNANRPIHGILLVPVSIDELKGKRRLKEGLFRRPTCWPSAASKIPQPRYAISTNNFSRPGQEALRYYWELLRNNSFTMP